jgi:hypothetical protein
LRNIGLLPALDNCCLPALATTRNYDAGCASCSGALESPEKKKPLPTIGGLQESSAAAQSLGSA